MSAGRTINTLSQNWGTPKKYVTSVKKVFGGGIDLDPCSNEHSLVKANDLSRLNLAFFTLNGVISLILGGLGVVSIVLHH